MTSEVADRNDESKRDTTIPDGFSRRRVLHALGAGAGIAAFSGVGQAHGDGHGGENGTGTEDERIPVDKLADGNALISDHEVHPVYGFSSQAAKVAPPVKPAHEVQALIRPREDVPIPEFFFEPAGLYVEPGDTVKFTMATPHHNVAAYHPQFGFARRVPQLVPPFSSPMFPAGGYWLYTFEKEGVYEMHCAPHEVFGMVMRIVVGEASGPAAVPLPDLCAAPPEGIEAEEARRGPTLRLPDFTAYTVLTDPALAPDRIVDTGRVSWDQLAPESKRLFIQPVGFPPCAEK